VTSCTDRIGRTPTTCPNVGELTTASIVENCTVLKTFVACSRTVIPYVRLNVKFFESPMFTLEKPGPVMMLRPAVRTGREPAPKTHRC
jgi:hypothetical protein